MKKTNRFPLPLLLTALALVLLACQSDDASQLPTAELVLTSEPTQVPTEAPSARLYFLAASGADETLRGEIDGALNDFASQSGLDYFTVDQSDAVDYSGSVQSVVILGDDALALEAAAAHPETRYILIASDLQSSLENVVSLQASSNESEIAAFMAGYAAALVTDDWRIAVIYSPQENLEANAFIAGVEYFCGSCIPVRPPYTDYPQAIQADQQSWQAQAQEALNQGVTTIYLSPDLEDVAIQEFLAQQGVLIIGSSYPGDAISSSWLATITPSSQASLVNSLASVLHNENLSSSGDSIRIENVNASYFSLPRVEHLQTIMKEIQIGLIAPPSQVN